MLIVMMILLVATTLAGVSLQATQYELRAAGFARSALQTQYVSETALTTTIAWIEAAALDSGLSTFLNAWNSKDAGPDLTLFGEPELGTAREHAMRFQWVTQSETLTAVTIPPLTVPGANNDPTGSFGPRVNARPGVENRALATWPSDYVVDVYDCEPLHGMGTPGSQINHAGSSATRRSQFACVVTARGRSYVPGGGDRTWADPAGKPYTVNRFGLAHDSRGTIVTPEFVR